MRILLSRTDSIGDVALTLPLIAIIKEHLPDSEVHFLGSTYTEAVVKCNDLLDGFLNWDELKVLTQPVAVKHLRTMRFDAIVHVFPRPEIAALSKKAGIPLRIGTRGRLYHWTTCNKLIRFSRKRSELHEAQLNTKLLVGLGIKKEFSLVELSQLAHFHQLPPIDSSVASLLTADRFNLILHPTSRGSAVEWGLKNFNDLISILPSDRFNIFVTGTTADREFIGSAFDENKARFTDLTGRLSLEQLIAFIGRADGLIAASTGPLHLAGLMNKVAIGLFSQRRPIHPGRWSPLGLKSVALTCDGLCETCAQGKSCDCILQISPERVRKEIYSLAGLGA